MSDLVLSASGAWGLRHENNYELNEAGYGNGGWTFALVEVATGEVVETWTGRAHVSPWDAWSMGVARVSWEGDRLLILYEPTGGLHSDRREERVSVDDVLARRIHSVHGRM